LAECDRIAEAIDLGEGQADRDSQGVENRLVDLPQ